MHELSLEGKWPIYKRIIMNESLIRKKKVNSYYDFKREDEKDFVFDDMIKWWLKYGKGEKIRS